MTLWKVNGQGAQKTPKCHMGYKTPRKQRKTGGPKKTQNVIRGKTALVQTHRFVTGSLIVG